MLVVRRMSTTDDPTDGEDPVFKQDCTTIPGVAELLRILENEPVKPRPRAPTLTLSPIPVDIQKFCAEANLVTITRSELIELEKRIEVYAEKLGRPREDILLSKHYVDLWVRTYDTQIITVAAAIIQPHYL